MCPRTRSRLAREDSNLDYLIHMETLIDE